MSLRPAILLLLSGAAATPAAAQLRGYAGIGLGSAPTGGREASQWSVKPVLSWSDSRARIELTGEYRDFGGGRLRAAGQATGSWFRSLGGPARLELTGTGHALGGSGRSTLGAWEAGPRIHLQSARQGAWLGAQAGRDPFGGTVRWEAAVWRRLGAVSVQVQGWQSAAVNRFQAATGGSDTLTPPDSGSRSELRVSTSFGGWVRWSAGRLQLSTAAGIRFGGAQPGAALQGPGQGSNAGVGAAGRSVTSTWWQIEGSYWLGSRIALAGVVGSQPGDPALLSPSGRYLQLGFRVALDPKGPKPPRPARTPSPARVAGLQARRVGAQTVELSLPAGDARTVEVMGDFTDWRPLAMERAGGAWWKVRVEAGPGLYRLNVRYDGGPWQAPPATRAVTDEFGAETGVVLLQ